MPIDIIILIEISRKYISYLDIFMTSIASHNKYNMILDAFTSFAQLTLAFPQEKHNIVVCFER